MGELTGGPKRRLWANPFREEPTVGAHHTRDHDDGENRRAEERKAARGGWLGGPNPYGYRYNPATAMLDPDEVEAETVRTIFDLYVSKRLGTKAVANWLNFGGAPAT